MNGTEAKDVLIYRFREKVVPLKDLYVLGLVRPSFPTLPLLFTFDVSDAYQNKDGRLGQILYNPKL